DLGNDGVHRLDYARRALTAAFEAEKRTLPDWPVAVSASGGKLGFDDAQGWPDTPGAIWDYPGPTMRYERRVWNQYPFEGESEGAAVYGTQGYIVIGNSAWRAFGPKGEKLDAGTSSPNTQHDAEHKKNFVEAIRDGAKPNFDISDGHVTSSLCHMA